ncbi:MAG TPA: MarR family transcriptional regulator [Caldimonas sp.]
MARRLGALGVRLAEHEILINLRRDPGIAQQTLARRCFNAKSHISALLTALEARGWVRRAADPNDARARKLFLTPAGERLAARTLAVQIEVAAAMAETVSAKTLADVTTAMGKISERLRVLLDHAD